MANPITRFFNALGNMLDDLSRSLTNGRSSDALLAETVDSMHAAWGESYEAIKSSGGLLSVSENDLAAAQSAAKTAALNVTRAVRDSKNMTGQELLIQQQKILRLQQMAQHMSDGAAAMEAVLNRSKQLQVVTEGKVQLNGMDMKLRESKANMDAALERMYGTAEKISDTQLRAAGYLSGSNDKDHSDELAKRAAKAQGRATTAQNTVEGMIGDTFGTTMSADEQQTLAAAYQAANVPMPETQATSTDQSASN